MALKTKYGPLIEAAQQQGVSNLQVREQNGVLYIDGNASTEEVKKRLWEVYNRIDPDYRGGDLVLNIQAGGSSDHQAEADYQEYEVVQGDNLSQIGERFGVSWKAIYEANRDQIKDPDLIHPGWKLRIPQSNKNQ